MIFVVGCEGKLETHCDFVVCCVDGTLPDSASSEVTNWSEDLQVSTFYLILVSKDGAVEHC